MGNENNLLANVVGTAGGFVNGILGGVVNTANSTVSGAATLVDGAMVGVGEVVAKGTGLAVTGGASFVDILCGYVRGTIGTVGGYLNNGVVEVVKVVGGEDVASELPRDGDFKEHFGELGNVIKAIVGEDGGMDGVRSSLAWPSKPVSWGGFNPFFGSSNLQTLSVTLDSSSEDKPVMDGLLPLSDTNETIAPLSVFSDSITQAMELLATLLNQNASASDENAVVSHGVDIPAFDGSVVQANDPLHDVANAVAVIV